MSDVANQKRTRRSRPGLESLEGRSLLSLGAVGGAGVETLTPGGIAADATTSSSTGVKELVYSLPSGAHVTVNLYGVGTLAGSSLDAHGDLNLVFAGTNQSTGIVGKVRGGGGVAPLSSVIHADLPANSVSGIGSSLIDNVNLKGFDLIANGRVNITGGVHLLFLHSAAANSQISLRELPESLTTSSNTSSSTSTANGVSLGFLTDLTGAQTLTNVNGLFTPVSGFSVLQGNSLATSTTTANPQAAPLGTVISIDQINGPSRGTGIGDPELFGYDPTTNALVRFDVTTGNPDLTIPDALPGGPGTEAGVTLGRDNGTLVLLVSDGSNVYAYNPLNGSKVGQFSLAPIKSESGGLPNPTRLGTFDAYTVVGDPTAGAFGTVQAINVTSSLNTGMAVALTAPYALTRAFSLSGGLAGIPGSPDLYAAGGAHFDAYQPAQFQLGLSQLTTSGGALTEASRSAVTTKSQTIPTNANGATASSPDDALGSINQSLALITAAGGGTNTVTLISPSSNATQGTVNLNEADRLSGITGTFRPALAGSVLIDVQGNIQSFRSQSATGLVLNDEGTLNLAKIQNASNTTLIAFPFLHAQIPNRTNVAILTSGARPVAGRNGVTVVSGITNTGPLSLP